MVQNQQAELQIKQQEEARKTQTAQSDTQLKQAEQQRKTVKDQIDARIKAKELQLDEQELKMQAEKDNVTFAANRRRDTNSVDLELAKLLDSSRKDRGNK